DAGGHVYDEDDHIGGVDGKLGLLAHLLDELHRVLCERFATRGEGFVRLDTACVDKREAHTAPLRLGFLPVAGSAGAVMDDGQPSLDDAVKQRGLAHVGPANECYQRCLSHRVCLTFLRLPLLPLPQLAPQSAAPTQPSRATVPPAVCRC